jgi:hypothetical protein
MKRPADTYDAIVLREPLGPIRFRVTEAAVRQFALATMEEPFERGLAQPTLLGVHLNSVILERYATLHIGGFQAAEQFTTYRPPRVGEEVELTGQFVDRYRKNGVGYVVLERTARGADGELIMHAVQTAVRDLPTERLQAFSRPAVPATSGSVVIAATRRAVTHAQVKAFGGNTRAHDDPATPIQGWLCIGLVSDLLTRTCGEAWLYGGQMEVKFVRPAYVGQPLTISLSQDLTLKIEDAAGRTLVTGAARCAGSAAARSPGSRDPPGPAPPPH